MRENLNWAVLGTGVIANEMAQALQKMGKSLYAVGNRTHQKAIDFAEKYGVGKVYDPVSYTHLDVYKRQVFYKCNSITSERMH